MNRVRATAGVAWLVAALAVGGASGCIEWLEVDVPVQRPGPAEEARAPATPTHLPGVAVLPNTPPRPSANGPVVPQTPGLRVPDGYWTRARLDQADLLLSHTWAVFQPVGYSPDGKPRGMVLRLQAHGRPDGSRRAPAL
ncbi:MAG: hypothetical protein QF464_23540, partial [Myxococcota bacterium]|nr:hypothetical protein [Myxococcota bacterium]